MNTAAQHTMNTAKNQCIQTCIDFNRTGLETIAYCLQEGGNHSNPALIRLLHDCVEICQTSADLMIRSSNYYPQICAICAEICGDCAESCESTSIGDKMMQACADSCRRAAESCWQLLPLTAI